MRRQRMMRVLRPFLRVVSFFFACFLADAPGCQFFYLCL